MINKDSLLNVLSSKNMKKCIKCAGSQHSAKTTTIMMSIFIVLLLLSSTFLRLTSVGLPGIRRAHSLKEIIL